MRPRLVNRRPVRFLDQPTAQVRDSTDKHHKLKLTLAKGCVDPTANSSAHVTATFRDSEAELVVDDAKPDLSRVDRHLLTDKGVLGPRVHVAERTFEASALADRTRACV